MATTLTPELGPSELALVLHVLAQQTGYDLRSYAQTSLRRRLQRHMQKAGIGDVGELLPRVLSGAEALDEFIADIAVPVTEMFRDPETYRCLREQVLPLLAPHPYIKIWYAGCASGEEVYSLAILLREEGLYERCRIYATDFSNVAVARAREGMYALHEMRRHTRNYFAAGGRASLADYYRSGYGFARFAADLRRHILFARHDLTRDPPCTEAHLVLCRNVMIYFDRALQQRVIRCFSDSLNVGGFLCLGRRERLAEAAPGQFTLFAAASKIYRKEDA